MDPSNLPKGEPPGAYEEIHLAARNRDADRVILLLRAGVDPNIRNRRESNGDGGNTPLWFAAQGANPGGTPVARSLLDAGARIDERCEYGTTALGLAAAWGHLDVVQFLVANGADPRVTDDEGNTPLQMARTSYRYHQKTVKQQAATDQQEDQLAKVGAVIEFLSNHAPETSSS